MFLRLQLILLFLFGFGQLWSQNTNSDSLISKANRLDDADTNKILYYCKAANQLAGADQIDKALQLLKKTEPLVAKTGHKRSIAFYNYVSGRTYYSARNYKESISYLLTSMKIYEEEHNKDFVSACCNIIGLIYQDQTLYDKAEIYFKKCLEIRLELKDSLRLSGTYSNLGLNYYKRAYKEKKTNGDGFEMREAVKLLNKALVIARIQKLPSAEATALGNLSNIMNDKGQYAEAKTFAERAMKIYQNMGDTYEEAISLLDIASISLAQNKPKETIPYLQKCLDLSVTNNYKDLQRYVYQNLATCYEKLEDYKQAFVCSRKLIALNDSVFNSENLRQINEMQIKYETEKKERDNAFLLEKNDLSDKAIKNQRTALVFIIVGLLSALVLAVFIFRGLKKQKKANRIISEQKREVENKNALINEQKELLEVKQKEILDSINYARRIQQAQMPTDKYVTKNIERLKKNT